MNAARFHSRRRFAPTSLWSPAPPSCQRFPFEGGASRLWRKERPTFVNTQGNNEVNVDPGSHQTTTDERISR